MEHLLPPLPPFQDLDAMTAVVPGPTPTSNWMIPGRFAVGANPCRVFNKPATSSSSATASDPAIDKTETVKSVGFSKEAMEKSLTQLLQAGINTIVCLQESYELLVLCPYEKRARELYSELNPDASNRMEFIHFPIKVGTISGDEETIQFVARLKNLILADNRVIYCHCLSGRGRAGTIGGILLAQMYGIRGIEALTRVTLYFSLREEKTGKAPETQDQKDQIKRLASVPLPSASSASSSHPS